MDRCNLFDSCTPECLNGWSDSRVRCGSKMQSSHHGENSVPFRDGPDVIKGIDHARMSTAQQDDQALGQSEPEGLIVL